MLAERIANQTFQDIRCTTNHDLGPCQALVDADASCPPSTARRSAGQ